METKEKCVSTAHILIEISRSCRVLGLHVIFYGLKETSVFRSDPCKNHSTITFMFVSENESNDVKIIIWSNITNHNAVAISIQITAMRSCSPIQNLNSSNQDVLVSGLKTLNPTFPIMQLSSKSSLDLRLPSKYRSESSSATYSLCDRHMSIILKPKAKNPQVKSLWHCQGYFLSESQAA